MQGPTQKENNNLFKDGGLANAAASESSKRPQTSHGRGRKAKGAVGQRRREEKTQGLGETSKDLWQVEDDDDESTKQIMNERKAEVAGNDVGFRRKMAGSKKAAPNQKKNMIVANDDLDDLDDLMGGEATNPVFDQNDEDDFFGNGNEQVELNPRKNKAENDDPLAFLQRAKQEKASNAQRKAQMEQEASAAWKRSDQLTHNLKNQYMDTQDKWKATFGAEIYKTSTMNVDATLRQRLA